MKFKWKRSGKQQKHTLKTSPQFMALGENFAMEFVKICPYKTFWIRLFPRRTFFLFKCCSLYMLKWVICSDIPLEIEIKL